MLLGGFFAAATALGQQLTVAPDADRKLLVVVGAGLAGDLVFQHSGRVLLDDLLQTGLVVVLGSLALGDEGQDEIARGLHAAVQIQRGNDRLERIGDNARAAASAAKVLAVAKAQILTQLNFLCELEQCILANEAGAHTGQLALGAARLVEQIVRYNDGQYAVAQKFQPLVVGRGDLALVGIAGMGQRNAQQRRIFECIVQDLLQFFRFVSHILSPFRLVRRGRAYPALNLISIALLRAVFFMPRAGHVRPLQGSFTFKRLLLPSVQPPLPAPSPSCRTGRWRRRA